MRGMKLCPNNNFNDDAIHNELNDTTTCLYIMIFQMIL